jgi:sulfur carrier protein
MALTLQVNGQNRVFTEMTPPVALIQIVEAMELKADRIAVEHNGQIAPRTAWGETPVQTGDKLEIVHFVGGGKL